MSQEIYIKARDLCVDFPIYLADRSLKRSLLRASSFGRLAVDSKSTLTVQALKKLNFEINAGDRVGLYGHNGAGKSTLLRVLTGAYEPRSGYLEVSGNVTSLLEISLGLDADATGRENILLRGLMMGMSQKEIDGYMDAIAEFSELGHYLDMPLRTYSAGMQVRLAFSVSTAKDPEILLLDEWLSAGDTEFQHKAENRLQQMVENSSILVLASHSISLLETVCNRIFYMEQGNIVERL